MKDITVFVPGLFSHAAPLLELADELSDRGHKVEVIGPEKFAGRFSSGRTSYRVLQIQDDFAEDYSFWASLCQETDIATTEYLIQKRFYRGIEERLCIFKDLLLSRRDNLLIIECNLYPAELIAERLKIPFFMFQPMIGMEAKSDWRLPNFKSSSPEGGGWRLIIENALIKFRSWLQLREIRKLDRKLLGELKSIGTNGVMPRHVIVPSFFPLEISRKLPPTIHLVGPILPKENPELEKPVADWLERNANESAVYVTLGTLARFTEQQLKVLCQALVEFPAIWAFPEPAYSFLLSNIPSHHLVVKWLPQISVLASTAIKLLICHGGQRSIIEAGKYCKPILSIPLYGDQYFNSARLKDLGVGLWLDKNKFTVDDVKSSVATLLNLGCRENASKIREIINKNDGLSRAANLIENTLQNQGIETLNTN